MTNTRQVRLSGFGGQGVVLAGTILGHAAIRDGKWVAGSSAYGAQARGGYASSDVIISDGPIVFPHVIEADILITLSQNAYDQYMQHIAKEGMVLYDDELVRSKSMEGIRQLGVPSTSSAIRDLNQKQVANIVVLGVLVAVTRLVTKEAILAAISENVPSRFKESNVKALELGHRIGSDIEGKG